MSKADADLEPGAPSMGAKSLCIPFQQPAQVKFRDLNYWGSPIYDAMTVGERRGQGFCDDKTSVNCLTSFMSNPFQEDRK